MVRGMNKVGIMKKPLLFGCLAFAAFVQMSSTAWAQSESEAAPECL